MVRVRRTAQFSRWLRRLRDETAVAAIEARILRLARGNPGDSRSIGQDLKELRIHSGPGYRVYYVQQGNTLIVLLAGGDKSSQRQDISRARELAQNLPEMERWR